VTGFCCPRCGRTSYHPVDVEEGYCGACHDWTGRSLFAGIPVIVDPDLPVDVVEVRGATTVRIHLDGAPVNPTCAELGHADLGGGVCGWCGEVIGP